MRAPRKVTPRARNLPVVPNNLAADLMQDASATRLTPVDPEDIHAAVGPDIDFYVEQKYEFLAEEQIPLWTAEGESLARPMEAEGARLKPKAEAEAVMLKESTARYDASTKLLRAAVAVLLRYVHREPYEYTRYNIVRLLLLGGDVAGGAGAAIASGEVVWLAVLQMLAVGTAAVAVGGLAGEIRHIRETRKRAVNGVPKGAEDFKHLFVDPDPGESVVTFVLLGGLAAVCLIFVGILSLRTVTDGSQVGLLFGCLAVVVTLGSGANSYIHADEVDDILHGFRKDELRARKDLDNCREVCTAPGERAAALEQAKSIRIECAERAKAAVARIKAAGREVLVVNPSIAGNGVARQPKTTSATKPDRVTKSFVPTPPSDNSGNGSEGAQERTGS